MANLINFLYKKSQNSRVLYSFSGKKKITKKKTLRWTGDHPQEDLAKFGDRLEKNGRIVLKNCKIKLKKKLAKILPQK